MIKRRNFIKKSILGGVGASTLLNCKSPEKNPKNIKPIFPRIISTWDHGLAANLEAWNKLMNGESGILALESGVKIPEGDPTIRSVGYGGFPDREGIVTLDACIMDKNSNCGAVSFLQNIKHPISVAKLVMEETPHVMLSGKGALDFALSKGFKEEDLLTKESKKDWIKWKKQSKYKPVINIENHDTIGMLAIDNNGDISGGCTTSGLAYKMSGRVGDSPIIGSGLFIDNEVGGAVATGLGEEVVKTVGSFLVVELMRKGYSPQRACEEAIKRIVSKKNSNYKDFQVAYIAINKKGETGSFSIHKDFSMTEYRNNTNQNYESNYFNN